MALGGSYYTYVREIPVGTDYEIWLSVGGWDEKWVRLVVVNFFINDSLTLCARSHRFT